MLFKLALFDRSGCTKSLLSNFVISFLDFSGFLTMHSSDSRPSKSTNSRSFSGPTLDVSFCVYLFGIVCLFLTTTGLYIWNHQVVGVIVTWFAVQDLPRCCGVIRHRT